MSYMTLETFRSRLEKASGGSVALVGIPSDANSSFLRGAAEAPPKIREALFSESGNTWTETGVNLAEDGRLFDAGDVAVDELAKPWERVAEAIDLLLERRLSPIVLGGDHAITYPIVKALRGKYDRLNILHFDAHPDLYHDFEGNPNSHASPFARVMENGLADRLVQVGIRTATEHQREQAARFNIEVIEMRDVVDGMTVALDRPVYVSVDMDGFDPAYAPGVSHPEPGGLTPRQVIGMIQALEGKIVGADVVEVNPIRDHNNLTGALAAKLVKELAAAMISR